MTKKRITKYITTNILLLMDVVPLYFIRDDKFFLGLYILLNILFLLIICARKNNNDIFSLLIFMLFTYSYGIEILIHYLHIHTYIELQYLTFIPLIILLFRNKKKGTIRGSTFLFLLYLVFNFIIMISSNKVPILYYVKSIIPYFSILFAYYAVKDKEINIKPVFFFVMVISVLLCLIQLFLGFHQDTRNGLFGVNGISVFSLFVTSYSIYHYSLWLRKKEKIHLFVFSLILSIIVLIIIENKAGIILYFISLVGISLLSKKISIKTILCVLIFFALIPSAFKIMIQFNPRFSYLVNYKELMNYFLGNNNWVFRYGRFESIRIIYNELDSFSKIFGLGFGSSTPQPSIFYLEAGRKLYIPYYTATYGYYHGFILTGISTLILDGGIILITIIICSFMYLLRKILKDMKTIDDNLFVISSIRLNAFLLLSFYLIYSNLFTSYNFFIVLGCILGVDYIEHEFDGEGDVSE